MCSMKLWKPKQKKKTTIGKTTYHALQCHGYGCNLSVIPIKLHPASNNPTSNVNSLFRSLVTVVASKAVSPSSFHSARQIASRVGIAKLLA